MVLKITDLTTKEKKKIKQSFTEAWTNRSQWDRIWDEMGVYANVRKQNYSNKDSSLKGQELDDELNDSSSLIAIDQATDSVHGILLGNVEDFFELEPTDSVLDKATKDSLMPYYSWASKQILYFMNKPRSNFSTSVKEAIRDHIVNGTSGVGSFYDKNYLRTSKGNVLNHRAYGVDIMAIDEGECGLPEYVYIKYYWRISRIINTFAVVDGKIDKEKYALLPEKWKKAWESEKTDQRFTAVFAMMPNAEFQMGKLGKVGAEYLGIWFDEECKTFFHLEFFTKRAILIARAFKRRGEIYGRSNGQNIISTIRMLNFVMGDVYEAVEKLVKPPLGMYNGALVGSKVIDTSSNAVNVLNPTAGAQGVPLFPLLDIGDITPVISFLIPYLKEQVSSGFKIDNLLDFNTAKEMTATEALRRYSIRSKSILGMLTQLKDELLNPLIERDIDLLMQVGELGVDKRSDPEQAKSLKEIKRGFRVIPDVVLDHIEEGRDWFKVKYNTELATLAKGREFEALSSFLMILQAIAAYSPDIIATIDWYKITQDAKETLGLESDFMIDKKEYEAQKEQQAKLQQAQMMLEGAQSISETQKNESQSLKNESDARR
jgi:hypothetical protein